MKPILTKTGSLPNLPWQERPADCTAPVWRYQENPIISRNPIPGVARIFNSAVIPYEGAFVGVFRGEQVNGIPFIYFGRSADGIHWTFDQERFSSWMKTENRSSRFMPTTHGWWKWTALIM